MSSRLLQKIDKNVEGTEIDVSEDRFPFLVDAGLSEKLPKETVSSYLGQVSPNSSAQALQEHLATESSPFQDEVKNPIIRMKKTSYKPDNFKSLQRWEGFVVEVREESFIARLIDLTEERPEEEAEFPFSEITYKEDLRFITEGAIFYWSIGYHISRSGTYTRASRIFFRRLPAWSVSEIKEAKHEAERVYNLFNSK
jgi:hypothetical protein